jgi:hypothetical protein
METQLPSLSKEELFSLESSVEVRIQKIIKDRRLQGPVNPKWELDQLEYDGMSFSKKYLDLLCLILLVWYSDLFQYFEQYLLYEISSYLERNLLFPELAAMTKTREVTLLVLKTFSKRQNSREIFGTILNPDRVERVVKRTRLRLLHPSKPKRTIRHRGYRDHGTLRPSDRWIENNDWSFREEQLLIEQKRDEYFDLVTSMVHQAGDWVLNNIIPKGENNHGNDT